MAEDQIKKTIRSKKSSKASTSVTSARPIRSYIDVNPSSDVDLTDRISISKKRSSKKVALIAVDVDNRAPKKEYNLHQHTLHQSNHKIKVRTFIRTIFFAGLLAFIITEYAMTVRSLEKAEIKIKHLTSGLLKTSSLTPQETSELKDRVLAELAIRINLPTDEQPTLVVIDNAEQLAREQPFYARVVNSDVIVIYQKAKKAIVWSPSRMKIVNAGVIEVQSESTETSQNPETTEVAETSEAER